MRVLALDTTTVAGSVAVVDDDRVVEESAGDPSRSHAQRLPDDLLRALERHGLALSDVDLFAVASGPGSFTGLRIGIATMQGLAAVRRRRVAGISALDALAHAAAADAAPDAVVAVWMDAHRHEVFSALYRVGAGVPFGAGRLIEIDGAAAGDPAATLARWALMPDGGMPSVVIGDGAVLYRDVIRAGGGHAAIVEAPPIAGAIGRLASGLAGPQEACAPGAVRPLYVRRPDVEIARDAARHES
jgi:tRNA threonylcarbamoyladenosine biosynthesis protein TsaB